MSDRRFERVTLKDELCADADGMPVFRKCFEHETLMSFYDDDGNYAFREWWEDRGAKEFLRWCKDNYPNVYELNEYKRRSPSGREVKDE